MPPKILVWHRNDLRTSDNAALEAAASDGRAYPLFIFDPHFYESQRVCDARIEFLHESLRDLHHTYEESGGGLAYRSGEAVSILEDLRNDFDRIYFNASTTAGYARERDSTVSSWDCTRRFEDDAIVREGPSRDGWQEQAEAYFEQPPHEPPKTVGQLPSTVDIEQIEARYSIDSSKTRSHTGGQSRAWKRLERFAEELDQYVGGISPPAAAEQRTSHLSPYLKFGCLSPREAYQYIDDHGTHNRGIELFHSRLFWNRHFTQKLQDNPAATSHAVNPVFRGMNRSTHDPELAAAWKQGRTGFPIVDASMRALRDTGWLNFRMRAMCASFYSYILRCWWKEGADWFYRHLIDADPAINYQQWQMQSGLVGVHPLRVYNPRKQVREKDPEGRFIRQYVPELESFPTTHLDQPEKAPIAVQEECGVRIGEEYPYPIVDFEKRSQEARETWAALDDRAKEALEDPAIERRASLSGRRNRSRSSETADSDVDAGGQTELGDF